MNSDIRVSITFRGHRKRRKLTKILGPGATDYLIDLWIATAVSRPDGVLTGWTPEIIAEEIGWTGDPDVLIKALSDVGFIGCKEGCPIVVHDWTTHQGWVSSSNDRSIRARINAMIKHHGRESAFKLAQEKLGVDPKDYGYVLLQQNSAHAIADANSMLQQKPADAAAHAIAEPQQTIAESSAHAPSPSPSPSPSPLPSQKDSTKVLSGSAGQVRKAHFTKKAPEYRDEITNVCKKVAALSNGSKSFNPYQWAQVWINKNGHPQAVIESLYGLAQYWGELRGEPWAYVDRIMKSKNGNYHERDETTKSQDYKKMLAELAKLIGAV